MSDEISNKEPVASPAQNSDDMDVEFFTESNKFKQMMFENLNGISAKFNVKYPINPKLTYEYPPINPIICQNIVNSLYKYPKFYTQTLHLMNKMNLPCPLVDYVREPYLNYMPSSTQPQTLASNVVGPESSSESEIECESVKPGASVPAESEIKKVKLKSLLKSTPKSSKDDSKIKIDDVFDRDL